MFKKVFSSKGLKNISIKNLQELYINSKELKLKYYDDDKGSYENFSYHTLNFEMISKEIKKLPIFLFKDIGINRKNYDLKDILIELFDSECLNIAYTYKNKNNDYYLNIWLKYVDLELNFNQHFFNEY